MNNRKTNRQRIRKAWCVLPLCLFAFLPLSAQTFTQRIQTPVKGQGTVTIHQDPAIDALVNSAQLAAQKAAATPATTSKPSATTQHPSPTTQHPTPNTQHPSPTTQHPSPTTQNQADEPVDTSKKVMRGYKVNGYRVQVFAGGNSRKDRQQAERAGNAIKAQFSDVPVYVHFYSPRWICRIGNYRTYEEAHQMLTSIRKMGYTQATIVKGKITVQN